MSNLESEFLQSYHLVRSKDQDVMSLGGEIIGKMAGLPTVRTTCNAVVMKMYDLDTSIFGAYNFNVDHWKIYTGSRDIEMGVKYPSHAIINVNNKETAEDVAEYLNKLFGNDRERFPRNAGWHAIATHGASKPHLSDKDHPFFYYKNHKKLNSKASRILVVVDLAGEGLNNRFINVWGAACLMSSVREGVQRIGRTLRTAAIKDHSGKVFVPPASHDTVYVITHEDFCNTNTSTHRTIGKSFDFILNGKNFISNVQTIEQYVNDFEIYEENEKDFDAINVGISVWDKIKMAQLIGECTLNGKNPRYKAIIKDVLGVGIKKSRTIYANAWLESAYSKAPIQADLGEDENGQMDFRVVDALNDLQQNIRNTPPDQLVGVLVGEKVVISSMNEHECVDWLASKGWNSLVEILRAKPSVSFVEDVNKMRHDFGESFAKTKMEIRQNPMSRIDAIVEEIATNIKKSQEEIRHLVMTCVSSYLGNVKESIEETDLTEDGELCKPEITYHLRDAKFFADTRGYVICKLVEDGKLNPIRAVLIN